MYAIKFTMLDGSTGFLSFDRAGYVVVRDRNLAVRQWSRHAADMALHNFRHTLARSPRRATELGLDPATVELIEV